MEGGDCEADGDRRPGGKKWAMEGRPGDSVQGNVTLGSVPRLEQGTGLCWRTGNALIHIDPGSAVIYEGWS